MHQDIAFTLSVKEFRLSRFSIAILAYVVLGVLAVTTLDQAVSVAGRQVPLSVITLVVLGLFAFRTWLHHKRELLERTELSEREPDEKAVVAPRRSA